MADRYDRGGIRGDATATRGTHSKRSIFRRTVLMMMVCGVIALELVNSSIERTVERPSPDRYLTAGAVKDMAAAAVLIFSIGSAVCGVLLFWNVPVFLRILSFGLAHPLLCVLLAASLVGAYRFIFHFKKGDR